MVFYSNGADMDTTEIAMRIKLTGQFLAVIWFLVSLLCLRGKINNRFVNTARYIVCIIGALFSIGHLIYVTWIPIDAGSVIYSRLVITNTAVVLLGAMLWANDKSGRRRKRASGPDSPHQS
jgi:nucleoside recognition membrane protein YjiH